jgi:hypothetical protein
MSVRVDGAKPLHLKTVNEAVPLDNLAEHIINLSLKIERDKQNII